MNKRTVFPALLSATALALCAALPAQAAVNLPLNQSTDVHNATFACTGVGYTQEQNARWNSYPVKLETVGDHGEYLAGETVTLDNPDGARMTQVKCDAPWVLMKLEPGHYSATVEAPSGTAKTISFSVPQNGAQRDVIVRFHGQSARNDVNGIMLPSGVS